MEATVTSVSFVNTPSNMALPAATRKMVVSLSNGQDQVRTYAQITQMIAAGNNQIEQANQTIELATATKSQMDTLISG